MRNWIPWLVLSTLLWGCARQAPAPRHDLTITPPAEWTGGELLASDSGSGWWTYFNDPGLDLAIAEALESNQDLRAAASRIEIARADATIAGAGLLPSVELTLNRSQQRQNFIGLPIPGGEDDVLSTTSTTASLRGGVSWEPDIWGRIREGRFAAVTATRSRYADLAGARLSLTGEVARAWFAVAEARRQLELAEAALENFRLSAERVRSRFQSGIRPSLDLRLALTEVARAEASAAQREEQLDRAMRRLEVLMGRYPGSSLTGATNLPGLPAAVPGGLPSELVHRRPDLVSAELQLLGADALAAQSRTDLRPRFSLTSGGGTSSSQLLDLLNHNLLVWNFVSGIVQPVFNNGRLRATVERNESQSEMLAANYESLLLRSYGEVESALAAESVLIARENATALAAEQAVAARDLAEQRYRSGLTDIITVLSAQRSAFESQSQLLGVRRLRLENRVDLHLALGGGFDVDDVPSAEDLMR